MKMLTDLDNYLFDLRGYLVLEGALSPEEVTALNAGIDALLPINGGEWAGYVHCPTSNDKEGINLQQIYEGGEPFEKLIDHPSWTDKLKHFVGGEGTFDYSQAPLFIDENFANIRGDRRSDSGAFRRTRRRQAHPVSLSQWQIHVRADQYSAGADGYWPRRWRDDGDPRQPQGQFPASPACQTLQAIIQNRRTGCWARLKFT